MCGAGCREHLQAMQSAERGKKRKVIVQPTQFAPVLVEILLSVRVAAKQVEQVGRMFVVVAIPFYQSHSFGVTRIQSSVPSYAGGR